ncbi:sugar-binding protein [Streptomyces uncialis]|uniref:Sugar-binding protein n=1 Tax=Streptomyces uncialis TaxID=1048205 RepID=A0A1Q4VF53_9ACTN|nr:DNRLRE domain-containing protein [Streptomyces uncialis]OKH96442.1 sugar-binding protein [Streptomyces uncialis]
MLALQRRRRILPRVAVAVAAVLTVEAAVIVAATGQAVAVPAAEREAAAEAEPKPVRKAGPRQAEDIPSARVAARLAGHRVEALSERSETSTTWANKDGSLTTELAAGPVRFERDGKWVGVDVELAGQPDGSVAPAAHPNGLKLSGGEGRPASSLRAAQRSGAVDLVTLGQGGEQLTLRWKGGLPEPRLKGTRAEYVDAVPGADVVVEATRTGFEQYVEVKERPAAGYSYTLPLTAKGLKAKQLADGSVLFTDRRNKKRAVMPAPVMWDAAVDKVSGEHTHRARVGMKVVQRADGVDLVITPDEKFLADPATKYPVTVDPSTSSLSSVFDTYVQQGETVDWSADTELDLGNPGTNNPNGTPRTARSFLTWNTSPVRDALITDAKLSLWNFHSGNTTCAAQPWEVWATGAASTSSRWTAQPAWTAKRATSTQTRGNPSCAAQPDGWIDADVTTLVQEWSSAKATRGHMGLRATSETTVPQWKRVNSANAAANPPKLRVTYNYRPRTGTKQEAGPPFFSYGPTYLVNTTTPTLRDTFVDADGDKVNGTFQIFDNATDTQVGNVIVSKYTPSGSPASVTVPAGVLTHGKTYKFRTNPYDGAHYNTGWSAWKTFTVDTAAPSAPGAITSTDYPAGQWVKGEGQPGTFRVTPPAADHNWLEWSLDGVTWTKAATGGASAAKDLSVTPPKNGTHTLQVRAVDKADNKSEAREYLFHAGPGGFVQPADGERTARRLPLVAEAKAGTYDSAAFSWRRSEADPWTAIPAGDVTAAGTPLTGWPVPLVAGRNAPLVWNTTSTVDPDGTVQLKADFTGPGAATSSTAPLTVVVDRDADGAASTEVGPGSVNLLTGDHTLSETDASFFGVSVSRTASSRTPDAGTRQEGQAAIFGKEWVAGTAAEGTESEYSHLRKVSDTAVSVVSDEGDALHFTADAARTGWVSEPGAEDLTLRGSVTGTFTLADAEGVVTTFTKPDPAATTWQVSSTLQDGLGSSTTTVVSETVTVAGKKLARPKRIIAPTSAVTPAACETDPATKGCRVLEFVYATATTATGTVTDADFGDFGGQLKQLRLWATAPGAANATATPVAGYRYDSAGKLRQTWDPRTGRQAQTQYSYRDGRVTWLEQPGELPYTYTYGNAGGAATSGNGMLLKAAREGLRPGTAATVEGEAVTSLVYGVPLTGTAAPHAMGSAATAGWGQLDTPSDATAVFPADSVPSSHDGTALTGNGYTRATVHYLNASGRQVNTATPGGHLTTTEYDRHGNTVRELTAANRALALGTTDAQKDRLTDLGIIAAPSAERAHLLSTTSVHNDNGTREEAEFGPLRRVDLTEDLKDGSTVLIGSGTSVPARGWTAKRYDEGRPTDGTAKVKDQVTLETKGAQIRDHAAVHAEKRVTSTRYDWAKGLPTHTVQDPGGLALTTVTGYDSQGRVVSQALPGGTATSANTRLTEYWTAGGTGRCGGRPEWADLLCWTGPAGAVTGGGSQPSALPDSLTEYGLFGQTTKVTDTAGGTTRTTATAHDDAGRPTTVTVSGGLGQPVPATTTGYDPATGKVTTITSPTAGTITKAYDKLGRLLSYTDADGGVTTTEYDLLDRPVKETDSVPSTVTHTYDHAAEPRGLATRTTDSVAGAFTATYDADGSVATQKLPGGHSLTVTEDTTGATLSRVYTRDSDNVTLFTDTVAASVHGQVTRHQGWSAQSNQYDAVGRLAAVQDTVGEVCTRRAYGFDTRSNRTSLTTATGASGAACPTTGGTTTTHTYDSGDRLVDTGWTYDALGRTTALPGTTLGYHANDLAHRQTTGNSRQTWQLDPALRFRSWTVETGGGTTWTRTASKVNHYDGDGDNPRWTVEDPATGEITRNVQAPGGDLGAVTARTGGTVLQLSSVHGDVALQLPLDPAEAPIAQDSDEYGNPRDGRTPARYDWLGAKQRSSETLTGLTLMGVRLYNPATGRFLSLDPVHGGSANAYDYTYADPLNQYDLDGRWIPLAIAAVRVGWACWKHCRKAYKAVRSGYRAYRSLRKFNNRTRRLQRYTRSRSYNHRRGYSYRAAGFCAGTWAGFGALSTVYPGSARYGQGLTAIGAGYGLYRYVRRGRC